jgi:rfaE bifunctional protein kinase chain/domain
MNQADTINDAGHRLVTRLSDLADTQVCIMGDVMLDQYLTGQVERISPEAPVPVVQVTEEWHRLGGAGNVARNIASLGGKPVLFGVCGDDPGGRAMLELMQAESIDAHLVCDPDRRTIRKTRILAQNQQVVRVDREDIGHVAGSVLDDVFARTAKRMPGQRVVIVSDYGKGLVSPGFMDRLWRLVKSQDQPPMVLVDPKVRNFSLYSGVGLITPNTKEALEGSGIDPVDRDSIMAAGRVLMQRLELDNLLITLGADGMALFQGPTDVWHIPTFARRVFDVTGAGDTVIASLALGLASGWSMLDSCVLANYAAGIVVGQLGTAAVRPDELTRAIQAHQEPALRSWSQNPAGA